MIVHPVFVLHDTWRMLRRAMCNPLTDVIKLIGRKELVDIEEELIERRIAPVRRGPAVMIRRFLPTLPRVLRGADVIRPRHRQRVDIDLRDELMFNVRRQDGEGVIDRRVIIEKDVIDSHNKHPV